MKILRVVLGDQLSLDISSLEDINLVNDIIFMCEVNEETNYVKHHKKKIAFIFSAMRHFALELQNMKCNIDYVKLDDPNNTGSFRSELKRAIDRHQPEKIIVTFPGEYRVLKMFQGLQSEINIPVFVSPDNRFLCSIEEFSMWAKQHKIIRLENFYREMRKKYNILMDDKNKPVGGKWNYDAENRKMISERVKIPPTYSCFPDQITHEVIKLVGNCFAHHFGSLEDFHYAVTRSQALEALTLFIETRLNHFGDYQDAMLQDEPWMYHSHISIYLNCGLLTPLECIRKVEDAYLNKKAPLNAVEGFIRQILGWREYVHGIYWLKMPEYASGNFLNANRALPEFYWTGETDMNCLKQCISDTHHNAYAHHIQRLMVLGNFALLAGIDPKYVNEWYLVVYADAYEWVELPNVTGMILFADGGYIASKPYAASGNYINKMSNYCNNCRYRSTEKTGPNACPFNYLYWDFLSRNQKKLQEKGRMVIPYMTWQKMSEELKKTIKNNSQQFLSDLKYVGY